MMAPDNGAATLRPRSAKIHRRDTKFRPAFDGSPHPAYFTFLHGKFGAIVAPAS